MTGVVPKTAERQKRESKNLIKMKKKSAAKVVVFLFMLVMAAWTTAFGQNQNDGEWIQLFNGQNLDNWLIKFTGYQLGVNYNNTFRVEDGVLKVSYDEWDDWNGEFGHIFYDRPFSHYILRVEYRFVGDQVNDGPGWAFRNNGLMLHSQDPRTMTLEQEFPVSMETQLLGGDGTNERSTLNLCTPGTNFVQDGELIRRHCNNSSSKTYHGDQWVVAEVEVRGSEVVRHIIDGEVVFEYTDPQYDERDGDARPLIEAQDGDNLLIDEGYISLQAESHPTEFRTIEVKILEK